MASRTINTCDRPGCGIEFTGTPSHYKVWIREWPMADIGPASWDLCDRCAEELHAARLKVDLDFGDRLRPSPAAPGKETKTP